MLLVDSEIRSYCCAPSWHGDFGPMITPFEEGVPREGVVSYGVTSAGYDCRLDPEQVMLFKNTHGEFVNPKWFKDEEYRKRMFDVMLPKEDKNGLYFVLPPHSYVLAQTLEYFRIPEKIKGRAVGKSTYARCCVLANLTPLEPEWEGKLTLEIGNLGPSPAVIFANEGIVQIEFDMLSCRPDKTYKDKKGVYQCQTEVTPARIRDFSEKDDRCDVD